ncbi:hypothetical protein [Peribacillus frigoritolerans]|uniref:hypothetical protein n=1 Tax=Peribacillus frigoritolerans TaxID=450367 RepID=UPI002023100F|nr:hypothetical protein [Peribacillus frigoritolerans]
MSKSLKDIVPPHLQQKALDSIPALSHFIVKKGKEYFYSAEGKRHLEDMLDDFFKERGKLINLIQLFIGNEKLIDKFQPEIIKFFEQSRTIDIWSVMLVKEWGNLEKWDIEKIDGMIGRETIKQWIRIDCRFLGHYRGKGVPILVEKVADYVINHFQPLFQKLHLAILWKNRFRPFRCSV